MEVLGTVIAATCAITFAAVATSWAQQRIGTAMAGTLAEKPELGTTAVLMVAIPETVVVLGFVVAMMMILGE